MIPGRTAVREYKYLGVGEFPTFSSVSRFRAAYIVSKLPDSDAEPIDEMSGSNLSRAYSRSEASQSGVRRAM
jgi:hypothetical protein